MKRNIRAKGPVGRGGLFWGRRKDADARGGEASGKNRRKRERKRRPYSLEEMMFYDDLFDGDG